jgi:hypothetical protein
MWRSIVVGHNTRGGFITNSEFVESIGLFLSSQEISSGAPFATVVD